MGSGRRRYRRAGIELAVTLEQAGRVSLQKTFDLSPYGAKVAVPPGWGSLPVGAKLRVGLVLPGRPALSVGATVARTDPDGVALNFEAFEVIQFAQLRQIVDDLLKDLAGTATLRDRRRNPRVDVTFDVRLRNPDQPYGWRGKAENLSPSGLKVTFPALPDRLGWGTGVQLRVDLGDGQSPLSLKGVLWRQEPKSVALLLVELGPEERERLKGFVDTR